jgi:hypothetical protein
MKFVLVKFNLFKFNAISSLTFSDTLMTNALYAVFLIIVTQSYKWAGQFNDKLVLSIDFYMCLVAFNIVRKRISDKLFGCLLSLVLQLFSHMIF